MALAYLSQPGSFQEGWNKVCRRKSGKMGMQMGKQGARQMDLHGTSDWMLVAAPGDSVCIKEQKFLDPFQSKTYFSLAKAKKPCMAFSIILSHSQQAWFQVDGMAGDWKIPVPCVHHPHLHPFCSSHSWLLSVMRWEDWARRQLQCHPVHPHIILIYCIVIN